MERDPYEVSAVQQGDRRVEYRRKRRFETGALLLIALWGMVMAMMAFSMGVSHGVTKGADACAAGDMVAIDRNVEGG